MKHMKYVIFFLLLTLFLFDPFDTHAQIPQIEREALIALYNGTNGDEWTDNSGWKEGDLHPGDGFAIPGTECSWFGVECDSQGDNVTKLSLSGNNLNGNIPPELGNLTCLNYLYLYDNQLSGGIPPELGNLTYLQNLFLCDNQLSGGIPPELGNLTYLQNLFLCDNQLSGGIPPELANLTYLKDLRLWGNQLSGNIPPELANLAYLYNLSLENNQLSGNIPPELGNLTYLQDLSLGDNQLSGNIPQELGDLSNLQRLNLYNNKLWGCIPSSLGKCYELQALKINDNDFSGEIPIELTILTNLEDGWSDFRENHLYTANTDLRDFLNQKQWGGDWETSQTFDTTIPMIEPSVNCGVYTSGNCFASFEDALTFSQSPTVVFVGEGEYHENITIENGFTLELTWARDFSCNPPTGPVIISGPVPAD